MSSTTVRRSRACDSASIRRRSSSGLPKANRPRPKASSRTASTSRAKARREGEARKSKAKAQGSRAAASDVQESPGPPRTIADGRRTAPAATSAKPSIEHVQGDSRERPRCRLVSRHRRGTSGARLRRASTIALPCVRFGRFLEARHARLSALSRRNSIFDWHVASFRIQPSAWKEPSRAMAPGRNMSRILLGDRSSGWE